MGDFDGHPFRGNQYTIQSYGTGYGTRYRVIDPLGKPVRHLRNIEHEGDAESIAATVTKRMLETGQELLTGHPSWDTASMAREAAVREHLKSPAVAMAEAKVRAAEVGLAAARTKREGAERRLAESRARIAELEGRFKPATAAERRRNAATARTVNSVRKHASEGAKLPADPFEGFREKK